MKERLKEIIRKRHRLVSAMEQPARAACIQMKDAGMSLGAEKLSELIFQVDALDQEMKDLMDSDKDSGLNAIMQLLEESFKRG